MGILNWMGKAIGLSDSGFWRGFFGRESNSGETVTYETALRLDAVWACISLISKTTGTLPCIVYDRKSMGIASDASIYDLLHNAPNIDDSASEFWEMAALSLCLDGNFFAEKNRIGDRLVSLYPLHPRSVVVRRDDHGARYYEVTETTGVRRLTEGDMLHVRGIRVPGSDRGLSPIGEQFNAIGNALSAEKVAGRTFANGMMPSLIISSDQILKAQQRAQLQDVLKSTVGANNAGSVTLLEAGLKPHQITLKPEDAQLLETRKFSVEQICRIFGVPPIMIGHAADGVTTWGSGVEQIILQFTKTGLLPLLKKIESAIIRDLLTPVERKKYVVKFNMEGFLRGDHAARAAFLSTMVSNGIYLPNEARAYENKPPEDGGDQLIVNSTMVPLSRVGDRLDVMPNERAE